MYFEIQSITKMVCYWCLFKKLFTQKIMDGSYIINLDKYDNMKTQWAVLHINNDSMTCLIALVSSTFQKR